MRKEWYEHKYLLEAVMLVVATGNGWLAYEFGPRHPIMAFFHAVVAVAMALGVGFACSLAK
jgi:K+-sensing histidine kinase KdpD